MSLALPVLLIVLAVFLGLTVIVLKRLAGLRNNTGDLGSFTPAVGRALGSQIASFSSLPSCALDAGDGGGGR